MIEHDGELHVALASPPTLFDVAVIARTLYTALGPHGWLVHSTRRLSPARLAIESRLPLRVVKERVRHGMPQQCKKPIVVDPHGQPAWTLGFTPDCIIVDYGGLRNTPEGAVRASGLGLDNPTYEAIAVIYEFAIARRKPPEPADQKLSPQDVKVALHLARKLLEAHTVIGSIELLDPNTVAYSLRSILRSSGYIADPQTTTITIDHEKGILREHIRLEAVTHKGEKRELTVDYNTANNTVTIRLPWGKQLQVTLLPGRRACITPRLCIDARREQQAAEEAVVDIEHLASPLETTRQGTGEAENHARE